MLYPNSRILTLVVIIPVRIYAWVFLGLWFLYQLIEANFGLFAARANGGGTAFFAHVRGFVFGFIIARVVVSLGTLRAGPAEPAAVGAAP